MSMVKSMTGYGRAVETVNGREFTVEVRSVNNRYLDCTVKLPRAVSFGEDAVKQAVKARISRALLPDPVLCLWHLLYGRKRLIYPLPAAIPDPAQACRMGNGGAFYQKEFKPSLWKSPWQCGKYPP